MKNSENGSSRRNGQNTDLNPSETTTPKPDTLDYRRWTLSRLLREAERRGIPSLDREDRDRLISVLESLPAEESEDLPQKTGEPKSWLTRSRLQTKLRKRIGTRAAELPLCECGCGLRTSRYYRKRLRGHHARIRNDFVRLLDGVLEGEPSVGVLRLVEEHFPGEKLAEEQDRPCTDRFTKAQQDEIRRRQKEGESHYRLAIEFGLSQKVTLEIVTIPWKEPTDV